MLASIFNNYINHLCTQLEYRFSTTFVNKPKKTALCQRTGVFIPIGHVEPDGLTSAPETKISDLLFSHIIDWWVQNTPFEHARNVYIDEMEQNGIPRLYSQVHMGEYKSLHNNPAVRAKFKVSRFAKVVYFFAIFHTFCSLYISFVLYIDVLFVQRLRSCKLDGIEFRSRSSQAYFKNDNACVMTRWNEEVKVRKGNKMVKVNKKRLAFGIIQNMYYHCLWPAIATHGYEVVIECIWYQYHGQNPKNGLVQMRRHKKWDNDCSVVFIQDCLPIQCIFYQSNPFAATQEQREQYMDLMLHHDPLPTFDKD